MVVGALVVGGAVVVDGAVVTGGAVVVGAAVVVGGSVSGGTVSGGGVESAVDSDDAVSADGCVVASVVVVGGGLTTGEKADAASRPATLPRPAATSAATLVVVDEGGGSERVENTAKPAMVSNETPSHAAKATRRVLRISPPPHVSQPSEPRPTWRHYRPANHCARGDPSSSSQSQRDGLRVSRQ
ncbi:MAG TPA: hypothetical protein VHM94_15745 [Acidimicrobiia bacterium]|jgi:hypothetical protein|nr:hypothetical protein [Acidimicrobiia bacterium]